MRNYIIAGIITCSLLSCEEKRNIQEVQEIIEADEAKANDTNVISVQGKIISIENGKDGYMATIESQDGQKYIATISIINLQKSGGVFERFEVGQTIEVSGEFWEDASGAKNITVQQVKAL